MAEPTKENLKRVINIFLGDYNNLNNVNYYWNNDKSYNALSSNSSHFDCILFSKNKANLSIQYKEVIWDVEYNKIRSNSATKIIESAKKWATRFGLENIFISTNFNCEKMPFKDEEIDKVGYWLSQLAFLKKDITKNNNIFEYNKRDYELLTPLLPYVSEYSIRKSENKGAVFGFGWSKDVPKGFLHYSEIFISFIQKKILTIDHSNTIFILEATSNPLGELDITEIKSGIKDLSCPEIWIVQDFINQESAFRIS